MARSECPLPFILLCLDVLFKWRGSIVLLRLSRVLQTHEKTQSHLFTGSVAHKPLDSYLTSTFLSLLLVLLKRTCTHDATVVHPHCPLVVSLFIQPVWFFGSDLVRSQCFEKVTLYLGHDYWTDQQDRINSVHTKIKCVQTKYVQNTTNTENSKTLLHWGFIFHISKWLELQPPC